LENTQLPAGSNLSAKKRLAFIGNEIKYVRACNLRPFFQWKKLFSIAWGINFNRPKLEASATLGRAGTGRFYAARKP
jgi:hypothetical protein